MSQKQKVEDLKVEDLIIRISVASVVAGIAVAAINPVEGIRDDAIGFATGASVLGSVAIVSKKIIKGK